MGKLDKGEIIYKAGYASEFVYIVFSGVVGLFDDESAADYLSRGEIFGIMSIYGGQSRFSAVSMEEVVCYTVEIGEFKKVFDKNTRFADFSLFT